MGRQNDWIDEAVDDPGRIREYLRRKYGKKAFFKKNGNIKMKYLNKAIRHVKKNPRANQENLLKALQLAKNLKNGID